MTLSPFVRTLWAVGALLFLSLTGCPDKSDGGDKAVWHDVDLKGSAEILSITEDGKQVTLRFTKENGTVVEKPLSDLTLSSIVDMPKGYTATVGDKIPIKIDVRWKGKASAGPPNLLHGKVDTRKITCCGIISQPTVVKAAGNGTEKDEHETSAGNLKAISHDQPVLKWVTDGGGEIKFEITPNNVANSDDQFKIHASSFQFRQLTLDLDLTAKDGQVYEFVKSVFEKPETFRVEEATDEKATPTLPTGTWTTIRMTDATGKEFQIDENANRSSFRTVYDFVAAAAKTSLPEPPPSDGFEPPPVPPEMDADEDAPMTLHWQTTGGGQINFKIVPAEMDRFMVHYVSGGYRGFPMEFELTEEHGDAHKAAVALFANPQGSRIEEKPEEEIDESVPQPLAGSWTTIRMLNVAGEEFEVESKEAGVQLWQIRNFVAKTAMEKMPAPEVSEDLHQPVESPPVVVPSDPKNNGG